MMFCFIKPAQSAGFSRIKKIPYQAPPTQLGPRKCTFWRKKFGILISMLGFLLFFGPFLGTLVEKSKHKKVAPNIDIWVPKLRLSKMYIFGAPIESEGPGMVSS